MNIGFSPADMKLKEGNYILTDVWSVEQKELKDQIEYTLPPHSSRMFSLNAADGTQIFDSNIRLEKIDADNISFETDYEADAELLLNTNPERVFFNGEIIDFTYEDGLTKFHVPYQGILSFEF